MVLYITFLKALAACLITNAHYTGIYPTDLIANGGLLGDVIFFAVSGYCLYNIKGSFFQWYKRRLFRCYLPVILITTVYLVLGAYKTGAHSLWWWFVYPTFYHFIASIVVLYIPYFVVVKTEYIRNRISYVMAGLGILYLLVYTFLYDKTYYHIDTVREPFIRFLFMESMLLGAYFRQNDSRYRNRFSVWQIFAAGSTLVAYFASKLIFSRTLELANYQILNQLLLFVCLFYIFRVFSGLDEIFQIAPIWLKTLVSFISKITLEIYVVQYVLIDFIRAQNLAFPVNWTCLTGLIIFVAFILHIVCSSLSWGISVVNAKIRDIKIGYIK